MARGPTSTTFAFTGHASDQVTKAPTRVIHSDDNARLSFFVIHTRKREMVHPMEGPFSECLSACAAWCDITKDEHVLFLVRARRLQ